MLFALHHDVSLRATQVHDTNNGSEISHGISPVAGVSCIVIDKSVLRAAILFPIRMRCDKLPAEGAIASVGRPNRSPPSARQ